MPGALHDFGFGFYFVIHYKPFINDMFASEFVGEHSSMMGGEHSTKIGLVWAPKICAVPMQRRKCLPKCWVAGGPENLQKPNFKQFFSWPQHVNRTFFCFHCVQCSGFVALWCFGHTFVSLPSLRKAEWRTQLRKNCRTVCVKIAVHLMIYDVRLGLVVIAAIRASKRAGTKVISDFAAWSESW